MRHYKNSLPWLKSTANTGFSQAAFLKRVQNFASLHNLFQRESHILVAVSGGADSIALLSLLHSLQSKYRWTLSVVHVNYHLRGYDSDRDMHLVERATSSLGIPLYVHHFHQTDKTSPSENVLRQERYHYFEVMLKNLSADFVALAHHQDDQLETFFINLFRGTGPLGLSGMQTKRGPYIRPLLSISRKELRAFLKTTPLSFREDTSNFTLTPQRNKVRYLLLPFLTTLFGESLRRSIPRLQSHLSLQNELMTASLPVLQSLSPTVQGVVFSYEEFCQSPHTFQKLLLHHLVYQNAHYAPQTKHLDEAMKRLKKGSSQHWQYLSSSLNISRNNDMITLTIT